MKSEVAYILGLRDKIKLEKDGQVQINENNKDWLLRVKNKLELLGYPTRLTKKGNYNIIIHSKELYNQVLKYKTGSISTWSEQNKKEFIKALASTQGSIEGNTFKMPLNNELLSKQVRYILLELGIQATIQNNEIKIQGTEIKKLYERIGIDNSKILRQMIIAM